ncbi:aspartic peptidase domain-containing protein [Leucosporidium creatinivorum]|uniref:Aspartic peptidase domain-containing protein n=1 Tax=Leucosporidium creatinivorum TaxID=106004 RepID=A0A1Y2FZH8_9BASI|nr:aspartic peptidase domain-containing protein [Leucosporidium creatinivorum]
MRPTLSLTTSALLLAAPFTNAQPTRSPRAEVPLGSPSPASPATPDDGTKIRLHRRGSAELMKDDGSLDWGRAHAHLARAQSKYTRSLNNFAANTGVAHFLDPSLLPPDLLNPSLARRNAWDAPSGSEASSLDWEADLAAAPKFEKRGDKVFGGGSRLKGAPNVQEEVVVANPSARKRATKNPKYVWNPKAHTSTSTSAAAAATSAVPTSAGNALTDYNDGMLWAGTVSIGTPPVNYIIDFDTGSSDLWIPSTNCTAAACNTHTKYDPTVSSTSKSLRSSKLSITYGDGSSTTGSVWKDTVTVAGISATAQVFGAANSLSSDWEDDPMDGMMGMAYASISQLGTSPFFQTLMTQSAVSVGQFSFFLASTNSELYLGGMNSELYTAGSTVFYPVTSQSYWLLSASANVGSTAVSTLGTFSAIIDTGTSVIVAPTASAKKFWAAVPDSGVYGSGYYTYPCDQPPILSFSFGLTDEKWEISSDSLNLGKVSSGSSRCVGAIVGADIGVNAWILGDAFLENVYATFDFDNNKVGFSDLA